MASLEDAEMSQVRQQQSMDPTSTGSTNFDNLATDSKSDGSNVDLHLSSESLGSLYLGILLCLGSWYLVGFSAPIQ